MKNFIQTIKNIWSIEELRNRILYTLALLLVYRFGSAVVLPGVDTAVLDAKNSAGNTSDILGLINAFTGGAFAKGAVFALGVMPYITASIIVQLLTFAVPYFQRLSQKEGESGRKQINQITRYLTIPIVLVQGSGYLTYLISQNAVSGLSTSLFWICNIFILAAGTIFAMWLGERITERGVGNGTSFIIMSGIIDALPTAVIYEFTARMGDRGGILGFCIEMLLFMAIILGTIIIIQGVRKIPVQFAKRMVGRTATATTGAPQGNRDYIPLKLNASGVMPIIFAQAIMFIPATLGQFLAGNNPSLAASGWMRAFSDIQSVPYNVIFFLLVVVFTYVYTALIVNPRQYSEYLTRNNAFIPGVKPGESTSEFIDNITTRITLPGSIALGLIAILPAFAGVLGIGQGFARFFGGTSLLIMIGVILDTLQQIESHLLMQKYDGLIKSGKLQGRNTSGLQQIGANG